MSLISQPFHQCDYETELYHKSIAACAFLWGAAPAATSQNFVDFGPAEKFIEPEIHVLAGSSSVTQNYRSCFPEIKDLNINMGFSGGIGGSAVFGLSNFLGLGTSLDIMVNNYNVDMAVVGPNNLSVSSLFINNRAYYLNIPVFVSFRFNPMRSMRWILNAGFYYGFGFAGYQHRQTYRRSSTTSTSSCLKAKKSRQITSTPPRHS